MSPVRAWEAAGEIPRPLLAEMGRLGFMGMTVPAEVEVARGADMVSYVLALEEIAGGRWRTVDGDERQQLARLRGAADLWFARAEGEVAEAARPRRGAGRVLPHRAACGLRCPPTSRRGPRGAAVAGC